jgi:hypothetical protein
MKQKIHACVMKHLCGLFHFGFVFYENFQAFKCSVISYSVFHSTRYALSYLLFISQVSTHGHTDNFGKRVSEGCFYRHRAAQISCHGSYTWWLSG